MMTHPARLYVILAREAPVAVILRRGPSRWVQMIKWHTDTDTFEQGQWIKTKVNGWNSDLSPKGELIIYLATSYSRHKDAEFGDSWTAISKPPYFTALVSWPQWGGGGYFIDDKSVYVGDDFIQPKEALQHIQIVPEPSPYRDLWVRKGWQHKWIVGDKSVYKKQQNNIEIWISNHRLELDRSWTYDTNIDIDHKNHDLTGLEWADFDQQGRLVLAKEGKLFSGTLNNGELQLTELADFNGNKPNPQPAPDWAQKW